ncbi:Lrp/AsnC family transcriptional regulator [Candidatus Woesearchaeota archaeon]|nr:Lrp/AsnC family transcriptional regulator [Candidatus Woesearchaeota archaeon]
MDLTDNKILALLKENSRIPFLTIAKKLSLSEGAIRARVKKLREKNIISRFTLDTTFQHRALVNIQTASHIPTSDIISAIKKIGADRLYEVTGKYTIIAFVGAENVSGINRQLEDIRAVKGVIATETYTILSDGQI